MQKLQASRRLSIHIVKNAEERRAKLKDAYKPGKARP
jgi:hypothetical protein